MQSNPIQSLVVIVKTKNNKFQICSMKGLILEWGVLAGRKSSNSKSHDQKAG